MLFPMIGNELLGISDAQEVTLCSPPKRHAMHGKSGISKKNGVKN